MCASLNHHKKIKAAHSADSSKAYRKLDLLIESIIKLKFTQSKNFLTTVKPNPRSENIFDFLGASEKEHELVISKLQESSLI